MVKNIAYFQFILEVQETGEITKYLVKVGLGII